MKERKNEIQNQRTKMTVAAAAVAAGRWGWDAIMKMNFSNGSKNN